MNPLKKYAGIVPACGVYCGGCPIYTREKKPCPGAEINFTRCERCKTFHLCCKEKNINHCYECEKFPCSKFRGFAKRWLKYGQNLIDNQYLLQKTGKSEFLEYYNKKADDQDSSLELS